MRQPTFSASLCKKKFLVEQIIESLTGIFPGFFSAELETRLRLEKAGALKQVDNRIIALKRDINKLKDVLAEYGTYEVSEKKTGQQQQQQKSSELFPSSAYRDSYTPCHLQPGDSSLQRKPVNKREPFQP